MLKLFATALLAIVSWSAMGQDSLRIVYNQYVQAKGREKTNLANILCRQLKEKDEIDSLYHFDERGKKNKMDFIILKSMGTHYMILHEPDSALFFSKKAIAIYKPGLCDDEYTDCLNNISIICQRTGRFYEALSAQKECYQYDIKNGDPECLSSSTNNLAAIYLATRQFSAAREFILKSIEIERKLNREDRLAIRYGTASEIFLNLDSIDESLEYAEMAYELDKKGGRTEKMAIRMSQKASALIKMNKLKEARSNIEKALDILEKSNNIQSQAICHNQLGNICLQESQDGQAAAHFRKAISLAKQLRNRLTERTAQKGLAQALKKTNPAEALLCMERYTEISDSIYKEETSSELNQFHSIYRMQELNEKNIMLNNKNETQRRHLIYATVIGILVFLLLVSLIAFLYNLLHTRNVSNSLLKKMEDMRLDFFTKITHEFRTPLTIISGVSEHIAQGKSKSMQETQHLAEMIQRNAQQLSQLTNQLLDISKLKATINEPNWRHGDLVAYTRMIIETFHQLAFQKDITLNYRHLTEEKHIIDFVPDYYNKIIYNLLSNSIKYTPQGGNVSITTEIKGDKLILKVNDTGIGIPKDDMEHIFEEYYVGRVTNSSISTGVGLSLVKQICDSVHGSIQIESEEGKGTTVNVSLPTVCPQGKASPLFEIMTTASPYSPSMTGITEAKRSIPDDNNEKPKILIVEDNEDVSRFISLLTQEHYQPIFAGNGEEGLEKARETVPDLIVSDLMMPKMNGIELCQEIRKDEMLSHIPFIIITANPDDSKRLTGLDSGADSYLLKPFNVEELIILIKRLIEQRKNMREHFSKAVEEGKEEKEVEQLSQIDNEFLHKLEECIYQQIAIGNTDVESIASKMCVSSKQLRRKIYALTNMTTVAYMLHVRLLRAKKLLKSEPQMSISEISLKCGFEDSGYFTKTFKQHYGVTPSVYRKERKKAD